MKWLLRDLYLYALLYFLLLSVQLYFFLLLDTVYRVGHCGKMTRASLYLSVVRMDG